MSSINSYFLLHSFPPFVFCKSFAYKFDTRGCGVDISLACTYASTRFSPWTLWHTEGLTILARRLWTKSTMKHIGYENIQREMKKAQKFFWRSGYEAIVRPYLWFWWREIHLALYWTADDTACKISCTCVHCAIKEDDSLHLYSPKKFSPFLKKGIPHVD